MRFDLTDLLVFRNIAEAGSITRGAERSNLALAAASTRIRHMEETLVAPLFIRSRQGVSLTPAGLTLLQHARTMLEQAERLQEEMGRYTDGLAGQIRLLSNTNALTEFLPEALSAFLAANPQVSIDIEEKLSGEIVGLIADGSAEIGIVAGTVDRGDLETFPFRRDRFVLVVNQEHPLASPASSKERVCAPVLFANVLDYEFVGLDRSSALQRFLAAKAARAGRTLRLRVQLRSFDSVCRLVECGVGVGIVPETTAHRARRTMNLSLIPLDDPWAERELFLCVRSYARLTQLSRQLVNHLKAGRGST